MKALTLTQPWATLVGIGAKRIETRSWPTEYRGRIAIHAAKGFPDDARYFVGEEPFQRTLRAAFNRRPVLASELPIGAIVGVATLTSCFKFDDATQAKIRSRSRNLLLPPDEADFGDYAAGRFGFVLADVVALHEPVPARGMLNLWNVPSDVEARVLAQVETTVVVA